MSFDTLFIFSPFSFSVCISAGVSCKAFGFTWAGVQLTLSLSGPRPWHIRGTAKLELRFLPDLNMNIDKTWGTSNHFNVASVDTWEKLKFSIIDSKNYAGTTDSSNMAISLHNVQTPNDVILVHPERNIEFKQKIIPFNLKLKYFERSMAINTPEYHIEEMSLNDNSIRFIYPKDYFALSDYVEMTNEKKLSSPSFEKLDSGFITKNKSKCGNFETHKLVYESEIIRRDEIIRTISTTIGLNITSKLLLTAATAKTIMRNRSDSKNTLSKTTPNVSVTEEKYVVSSTLDTRILENVVSTTQGGVTFAQAEHLLKTYVKQHGGSMDDMQITPYLRVTA